LRSERVGRGESENHILSSKEEKGRERAFLLDGEKHRKGAIFEKKKKRRKEATIFPSPQGEKEGEEFILPWRELSTGGVAIRGRKKGGRNSLHSQFISSSIGGKRKRMDKERNGRSIT